MSCTVGNVLELVNGIAPFELAEQWDNVGLLAGSPETPVTTVLCALDLRMAVLREAERVGAELIVTHHPILFRGRKNLCETDGEGRLLNALVRSGIAMIAAHTNFDNANPGVNDALAAALGLSGVEALESGMRMGTPKQTDFGSFCEFAGAALGGPTRCYGEKDRIIHKVAVLGGVGEDYARIAREARGRRLPDGRDGLPQGAGRRGQRPVRRRGRARRHGAARDLNAARRFTKGRRCGTI